MNKIRWHWLLGTCIVVYHFHMLWTSWSTSTSNYSQQFDCSRCKSFDAKLEELHEMSSYGNVFVLYFILHGFEKNKLLGVGVNFISYV